MEGAGYNPLCLFCSPFQKIQSHPTTTTGLTQISHRHLAGHNGSVPACSIIHNNQQNYAWSVVERQPNLKHRSKQGRQAGRQEKQACFELSMLNVS